MQAQASAALLKRLVQSNIKTQEAAAAVVASVKELVSALKAAGEAPEPEVQILKDINEKLNKLLQQHIQLATALDELLKLLKQPKPMEPPPQPSWRQL